MAKNIQIIIGSTRQNRVGGQVAEWVKNHAENHPDINIEVIDLLEENLPFFDAPTPPLYAPDTSVAGQAWAKKVDRGDGFIFVTPEYNLSIPASLKNALDFLVAEWNHKPATIVSYGWVDGGQTVSKHLNDVLSNLKVATAESTVNLKLTGAIMAEDGSIKDVDAAFAGYEAVLEAALEELVEHEAQVPVAA